MKQYKDLPEEEIKKLAQAKLEKELKIEKLDGFNSEEEKELANSIMEKYTAYNIEDESEKDTLNQLVYLEVIVERVKKFIDKEFNDKSAIPMEMLEELRELNSQVLELKAALGVNKEKERQEFIEVWEDLQQKAINHYNEHAGEYYQECPKCHELFRGILKITDYDFKVATFFKETDLYNPVLYKAFHEKRLTLQEMADTFGVDYKYINLIYEQLFLKGIKKNVI